MEQPDQENNLGWHFTNGDKLRDGRPVPPVGETLIHEGGIQICQSGLHCSKRLIDALRYAPGATLHQVRFGGEVQREYDKLVSRERTILRTLPQDLMLPVLVEFSAWCAKRAAEAAEAARAEAAEAAEAARAARAEAARAEAAEAAAGWVAVEAARAARVAGWAARAAEAAEAAAWVAAATEAAEAAARAAGWAAEREAQNQELTRLVEEAFAKMEAPK